LPPTRFCSWCPASSPVRHSMPTAVSPGSNLRFSSSASPQISYWLSPRPGTGSHCANRLPDPSPSASHRPHHVSTQTHCRGSSPRCGGRRRALPLYAKDFLRIFGCLHARGLSNLEAAVYRCVPVRAASAISAYWRAKNNNPALASFLALLRERYPSPAV
jgi:hypothetical protein